MASNKRLIAAGPIASGGNTADLAIVPYTGTGSTFTVTTDLEFSPDLIWVKNLGQAEGGMFDPKTLSFYGLETHGTSGQFAFSYFTANSNGFDVNSSGGRHNASGIDFIAYCFNAGGSPVTNTDGSVNTQVAANTNLGFSIVTCASSNTGNTLGHGLGTAPQIVIARNYGTGGNWSVNSNVFGSYGSHKLMFNNDLDRRNDSNEITAVSSTTFTVGGSGATTGANIIYFCFTEISGISKFGTFTGNGTNLSVTGFGFMPRLLIIKRYDSTGNWVVVDSERSNYEHYINLTQAQSLETNIPTLDSDGFTVNNGRYNNNGASFFYMAFA